MPMRMSFRFILPILLLLPLFIAQHVAEQSFLGTHFFVNQDKIFVDNTLKSVSTLARPYDLVAFIRQAERLERVEQLQTYIDAVDEVTETTDHQQVNSIDADPIDSNDKCNEFLRDGESLIFKILKTHLYDTFYIPLELKNISLHPHRDRDTTKILTCTQFCQTHTSLLTFDHLASIATRYDEQQTIHIDDDETNNPHPVNYDKQAAWSTSELTQNRTSWLAYVYLSRYFSSNASYQHAIDCLRCALVHGSIHEDVILIELANIVFRYGYLRDAIVFIERALDYHLREKISTTKSVFIRAILHYYLGNLCTIDNRFLLAIQFYNRTNILLDRIQNLHDEQQLAIFSASSLGSLSISSLSVLSRQKIDALQCHLTLELSLQQKHRVLQTKLAQLNQLRSINDELIQLNALIKRDMSHGQSMIDYLRRLKEERKQLICDWKSTKAPALRMARSWKTFVSPRRKYSTVMKRAKFCAVVEDYVSLTREVDEHVIDIYDCRTRDNVLRLHSDNGEPAISGKSSLMALRLAAIERTQASFTLTDGQHHVDSFETSEQITLTSTTTWPTLTSRLPTDVILSTTKEFILRHSTELYPALKEKTTIKLIEIQLPSYTDCQIHYFGLPSIGDYPTVWLPLENKGLLNIKQVFYQGLNHPSKHYPLPWSPPLCTLQRPLNEHLSIIENHSVLRRASRQRAPTNRFDTNMLLNLYFYIDSATDEQLPIEEFGQRLRAVANKHEQLLPEWIVHLLSSLYWRVNGHLPHAIDCGLKAHETIIKNKDYKQLSDLTLINLANILYLWGKYEDALDLTQQAFNINAHEPITNYFLGNLLALTKNNHSAAQEYYRRTLAIDPTHIYARRQLRLSYCYTMHTTWELMGCTDNKNDCDDANIRALSIKCTLLSSQQNYHVYDATVTSAHSDKHCDEQNIQCQQSLADNRSSIDRWMNRSSSAETVKRDELLTDAQRAYHSYGLCASALSSLVHTHKNGECSQGFAVTEQGYDIGHLTIVYDHLKQAFDYAVVFTNDYEHFLQSEGQLKCIIYGTGRKSSKCRELGSSLLDPNEVNPKHNMTWWRDPSTLYEHLKELMENMNYEQQLKNRTHAVQYDFYDHFFADQYILSRQLQEKYLFKNSLHFKKHDCQNKSSNTYTPYLSTWISPQTKNVFLNYTFFKQLNKLSRPLMEPICAAPMVEQRNNTKNVPLLAYTFQKINKNLTQFRPETILRPILLNLLFEKTPSSTNKDGDDKALFGSLLASGLSSPVYNTSWLFYHTASLYWRLMGNASQALNCLFQSHLYSPSDVQDLTYLSMALIIYNSQLHVNEAIYLLYESLAVNRSALLLTHFTLGNAMARKSHLKWAEKWYQSALKLKSDFEPAKQRLRAIQC